MIIDEQEFEISKIEKNMTNLEEEVGEKHDSER